MKDSIVYKGERIAKGSDAYAMWMARDFKKLDTHMRKVHSEAIDRGEIRDERYGVALGGPDSPLPGLARSPDAAATFTGVNDSKLGEIDLWAEPADAVSHDRLKATLESLKEHAIKSGEFMVIVGHNSGQRKSMLTEHMIAVQKADDHLRNQERRSAILHVTKARALPGSSGLTLGDINGPIINPDTPNS